MLVKIRMDLTLLYLASHPLVCAAWRTAFSFGFNGGLDIDMDYQGWHSSVDLSYYKKTLTGDRKLSLYVKGVLHFSSNQAP